MQIEIVGKEGFKPTEAIIDYVERRLEKPISLFNENLITSVRVTLKKQKSISKVEVTMYCKGITLRSEVSDPDMYKAIDKTNDKLVSQVRKHKTRITDKFARQGIKEVYNQELFDSKDEVIKKLVRRKLYVLNPMSVSDALLEMEMMGHDFYVFLNEETNHVNVCYIRSDGDYALIETR